MGKGCRHRVTPRELGVSSQIEIFEFYIKLIYLLSEMRRI